MLNKNKKGFTLVELLISITIMSMLTTLAYNFIQTGFKSTRFVNEEADAIKEARDAMSIMIKEIRGANNSEQGSYPLEIIDDDNFTYYSDIDEDGQMEKVKYFLDATVLKKVVKEPGASNDYNTVGATSTVANYVNNQTEEIFSYYDSNNNVTTIISAIRLIKISLKINVTPEIAPNDYYVESDVHLRNLKDNL